MLSYLSTLNATTTNARPYIVYVGYKADFPYKGPLNLNDPNPGDGFIDNYLWYTEKGKPGYHFLLYQWEYNYHESAYFDFVQEFLNTLPNADVCTFSGMGAKYDGAYCLICNPPQWPDKAGLIPAIAYGKRYYTSSNLKPL